MSQPNLSSHKKPYNVTSHLQFTLKFQNTLYLRTRPNNRVNPYSKINSSQYIPNHTHIKRITVVTFFKTVLASTVFSAVAVSSAFAGEQYIDDTGFAVSGYDVVAYFDLPQTPIGTPQAEGVPGLSSITAEYNNATFAFSSEANRDRFVANPAAFAPQFDGHCAYGVAQGGKVPANPNLWRIVDGELFLNITKNVVGFWEEDIPGNITSADSNWGSLEPTEASARVIPQFTSAAPLN